MTLPQAAKEYEEMAARKTTPKKTNGDMIERARYDERLPCKVEGLDIDKAALEMAKVHRQREATREAKRESNAKFRERLSFFDERLSELAETVEGKTERRSVEVVEYLIPRTNEIRVVRQDTLEVLDTRAAKPEELQEPMFAEGENPKMQTERPPSKRAAKKKALDEEENIPF